MSVEVNDVHLSGVWLLNAGRVLMPRIGWESHEEILHRCRVLPSDLREHLDFDIT
jgi:hypothetical protein